MSKIHDSLSAASAEMLAAAVSQVRELVGSVRKDGRKFKLAYDGLSAGVDDANAAEIKRFRPLLDRARQMLDLNLTDVQYAQETVARLRNDPAIMATRADQVETLAKAVGQARRQFIERVQLARALDGRADKALEGNRQKRRDAEVDIGALRLRVRGCARTLADALTAAEQLAAAARKAFEKKDQKALTEARTRLIELKAFDGNVLRLRPEVQQLARQHPDLDREQRAEVQWMLDDLERVEDVPATIDRLVRETMALGQVPAKKPARPRLGAADAQKLIRTFGLPDDGSRRTKAAKILADDAIEAWPRELARLYGGKESELKARLGEVRKLAFVRAMAPIDL
jgi:chromosome segregation ATPase